MDVDLTPISNLLPWLATASPAMGLAMRWLRGNTPLAGFGLLGVATVVACAMVGALGMALGWDAAQWRGAPLGVLMLLGGSVLTDTTSTHLADTIKSKRLGKMAPNPPPDN